MGSGKTTIGRLAAERLGRPFLDTDAMIEQRTGRTVRSIFAEDGEVSFRDLDSSVLADAVARHLAVRARGNVNKMIGRSAHQRHHDEPDKGGRHAERIRGLLH